MTDTTKNTRTSRDAETREASARRKPWAPPSRLDAPPPPAGFKQRWIRAESAGQEDRINVASKVREGYELVRADAPGFEDYPVPAAEDGRHAGVISVGGLLLARIPEETVQERNAYYQRRANDQSQAVDSDR